MNILLNDGRVDLLTAIAREAMGIETLEPTGKVTADFRVISVENLAHALEAAYDAGLLVGAQAVCSRR
jgi:hypothetical protein